MFFRNLTFLRFPTSLAIAAVAFDKQLAECALKPVGPMELSSRGFISPTGQAEGDGRFAFHTVSEVDGKPGTFETRAIWLSVGSEERMLPGAVVQAELTKRLKAIEEKEGRKPGGRARKRLKDEIVTELLPRAFVRPGRVDGYLDLQRGLLVVDTASRKQAEAFASELRRALGSFPALPLNAEVAPRAVLTGWVAGDTLPEGLTMGDEVILKDAADKGATIRATRQELNCTEIGEHLAAGKQATRLALLAGEPDQTDHVSFTFDEDLVVRKLKLLDGAVDSLERTDADDLMAELDARFFLLTEEVGRLFDTLERAFKLSKAEA